MAFLAGVWLVLSPYVFTHGVRGLWSDLCAGAFLAVTGAASLVDSRPVSAWRPVRLILAAWLIAAPLALGLQSAGSAAWIGDVLVGGLVLVTWMSAVVIRVRARRTRKFAR